MNTILKSTAILIAAALMFSSCKKDNQELSTYSCKINGTPLSGSGDSYYYASNGILVIKFDFPTALFQIQSDNYVGTFDYSTGLLYAQVEYGGDSYNTFFDGYGTVSLTAYADEEVSGTFQFTADGFSTSNIVNVTEGVFNHIPKYEN